jgi:hypothetical protein
MTLKQSYFSSGFFQHEPVYMLYPLIYVYDNTFPGGPDLLVPYSIDQHSQR